MKKLLLILIALPMIGFGQVDKIIFSSGDTIYGKVIEVGVNDITYQHKDETTNNVSEKRELAKVIYSSDRIETFDGLQILEKNQEKELRKQKKKGLSKKQKHLYLQVGINQFIPSTASPMVTTTPYVAKIGFSSKLSYQVYINENLSYIPSAAFHFISFGGSLKNSNEYNRYLLGIGNEIEYNINNRFYISSGLSLDFLLANNFKVSRGLYQNNEDDLGYYSSFILNFKYILNKEGKIRYFIFSDSKIPFSYSNQPKDESIGGIPLQLKSFNLQLNTTISFGVGANF